MTVTIRPTGTGVNNEYGTDDNGDPVWNLRKSTAATVSTIEELTSVPYIIEYNPATTNQGTGKLTIKFTQAGPDPDRPDPINFFDVTGEHVLTTDVVLNGPSTFRFIVRADPGIINGLDVDDVLNPFTQTITAIEELETSTARWHRLEVTPAGHMRPTISPPASLASLPFSSQENTKEVQVGLRSMRVTDNVTVEGMIQYPDGGFVATPMTDNDALQVYPSGPISSTQIPNTQIGKLTFVLNPAWDRAAGGLDATFEITTVDTSLKTLADDPIRFTIELATT